jgi:dipeptidyl aminopeptidase/acylaminoacyl peptidase
MERRIKTVSGKPVAAAVATALSLALATQAVSPPALAQQTQALDTTSPRIATNQEATDVATKLQLIEQEIQSAEQEALFSNLLRQYDGQMVIRRFFYPSGTDLVPAYLFAPKPLDSGKHYPGLVMVHGAWHGRLEWRYFDLIAYAVSKGYVVMFPEYHSSAGYGENIHKSNFGNTDVADVLAAADYLAKSVSYVDANRLGIFGHSRGGMLTLLAIEHAPTRFKAAVDVAGLADMIAFMAYKPDYRRMETANEPAFGGKLPAENLGPYMEISPLNYIDDIQTPLFLAATTGDKVVPLPLHIGRVIDALKARDKVFESKIYDHAPGDHLFLFGDTPERKDLLERTFGFLGKYLKP